MQGTHNSGQSECHYLQQTPSLVYNVSVCAIIFREQCGCYVWTKCNLQAGECCTESILPKRLSKVEFGEISHSHTLTCL